jgi:hypothetical protein
VHKNVSPVSESFPLEAAGAISRSLCSNFALSGCSKGKKGVVSAKQLLNKYDRVIDDKQNTM